MGRGNSIIRDRLGETHPTFFIDYYEHSTEINEETGEPYCSEEYCSCNDSFHDDLIGNITTAYQNYTPACRIEKCTYEKYRDYYESILHTSILELVITDNEGSIAIGCIPVYSENDKYNNYIYTRTANNLMRIIANIYPNIRKRTGPWTSGNITNNQFY